MWPSFLELLDEVALAGLGVVRVHRRLIADHRGPIDRHQVGRIELAIATSRAATATVRPAGGGVHRGQLVNAARALEVADVVAVRTRPDASSRQVAGAGQLWLPQRYTRSP